MDTENATSDKLIDQSDNELEQPVEKSLSDDEEKASDFQEYFPNTNSTADYLSAQVAVETVSCNSNSSNALERDCLLKPTKCRDIAAKLPEDRERVFVMGVVSVSGSLVVVDNNNAVLKLFDRTGKYISSTKLNDDILGITYVSTFKFATCNLGNEINIWTIQGQVITNEQSFAVGHITSGIDYNGTYYCVVHGDINAITILDRVGFLVGIYAMKEAFGRNFTFGCDIHMDRETNNMYVPCRDENGILCMTVKGKALWFTRVPFDFRLQGITELRGTLCVADRTYDCLHLITKTGEYVKKLFNKIDLIGTPNFVSYDTQEDKLYVTFESWRDSDKISVYSVNQLHI